MVLQNRRTEVCSQRDDRQSAGSGKLQGWEYTLHTLKQTHFKCIIQ